MPERQTSPAQFAIRVDKVQIGLSSRTVRTSARATISSPTPTALRNFHSTPRNTVPGPGRSSATRALRSPERHAPLTKPPNTVRPASAEWVVERVPVARHIAEGDDVACSGYTPSLRDSSYLRLSGSDP